MFEDAKIKTRHAAGHIHLLRQTLSNFISTNPYTIEKITDPSNPLRSALEIKVRQLPEHIPAIIGDAVHNLRSALDYLIFEMLEGSSLKEDERGFPFGDSKDLLINKCKKYEKIKKINPTISDFICDELQPYPEGGFWIWELNKMNNIDKHRLLLPICKPLGIHDISIGNLRNLDIGIQPGKTIYTLPEGEDGPLESTGRLVNPMLGFEDPNINRSIGRASFKSVDETLLTIYHNVVEIVTRSESFWAASLSKAG